MYGCIVVGKEIGRMKRDSIVVPAAGQFGTEDINTTRIEERTTEDENVDNRQVVKNKSFGDFDTTGKVELR